MRKIFIIFTMLLSSIGSYAQSVVSSIFRQKALAKKYNLEQLALLRTYKGYVNKGYAIANKGLGAIGGFTDGEFKIHETYFNSLQMVSPVVKKYPRVSEIITMQLKNLQIYNVCYRQVWSTGVYSNDEMKYIKNVFENILDRCNHIIDELSDLTTNGKLEMRDDERLQRIDILYDNMVNMLSYTGKFALEARQFGRSKRAGNAASTMVNSLYTTID